MTEMLTEIRSASGITVMDTHRCSAFVGRAFDCVWTHPLHHKIVPAGSHCTAVSASWCMCRYIVTWVQLLITGEYLSFPGERSHLETR